MGKSTAANGFRGLGVPVFDADREVHRLQGRGGAAVVRIGRAFPGTVKHGILDRGILRTIVLGDRSALKRLEGILHPLVRKAQARFLARARAAGKRLAVLDVPLLFETGGDVLCDAVVVVSAPADVQLARVRARRKMNESQIKTMIGLQMPDREKRAQADFVIMTGLSRHYANRAIRRLVHELRGEEVL